MIIDDFGGAERLRLADMPMPTPQDDEVLVQLAYTSVNPVDWKIREGLFKDLIPHQFPIILGWDAAGTVSAVGKAVSSFKAGDKVYGYCRKPIVQHGTYAEFVTVRATALAAMPDNISFAEGASIPLTGLTAWQALFDVAQLTSGETVLIHAGAGGVGSLAIQFAKQAGAKVYTTASAINHDYVKSLGANTAIDYKKENFIQVVKTAEPSGVDVVFDTVGDRVQQQSFEVLKPGGRLVSIVAPPPEDLLQKFQVKGDFVFVEPNGEQLRTIASLIAAGKVKPAMIEEMPLVEAALAQETSRGQHVCGKIVLKTS
jgi:NADPH2:quinone reductase